MESAKQLRDLSKIYMEAVYGGGKKNTEMVVTNADKKANTPAYQNLKKGVKGYKAADHMKEGLDPVGKEDGDVNNDGKKDSSDSYLLKRRKAIAKAMGKDDKMKKEERWWDVDVIEEKKAESPEEEEEKDEEDDELEGSPNQKKKKVKHNCASKVKHEEYGLGTCVKGMHTLDEEGNVSHYDILFEHGVEKNVETSTLNILEYSMHEHAINDEKNMELQEKQETEEYIETVSKVKKAELEADIERWSALEESGKFTAEEIESLKEADRLGKSEVYILDEVDDDLLQFVESSLGNFPEDQILDMMESMYHRRNPGKKHPLESGSSKVTPRPVSDAEKKSTDKQDRMYVAMRRVKDRQQGYSKAKSDAADRLHGHYTDRQSKRKKGASPKEAAAGSHGDFGSKGFNIKRGGRKGLAPRTDRGTGNKAARRAGQEVKNRDPRK